jgi:hypothetical protein
MSARTPSGLTLSVSEPMTCKLEENQVAAGVEDERIADVVVGGHHLARMPTGVDAQIRD